MATSSCNNLASNNIFNIPWLSNFFLHKSESNFTCCLWLNVVNIYENKSNKNMQWQKSSTFQLLHEFWQETTVLVLDLKEGGFLPIQYAMRGWILKTATNLYCIWKNKSLLYCLSCVPILIEYSQPSLAESIRYRKFELSVIDMYNFTPRIWHALSNGVISPYLLRTLRKVHAYCTGDVRVCRSRQCL